MTKIFQYWLRFVAIFLCLPSLIQPCSVAADSLQVGGASIPVEEFQQVDTQTSKITVGGITKLIRTIEAPDFVVSEYVHNPTLFKSVDLQTWKRVVDGLMSDGAFQNAAAIIAVLATSDANSEVLSDDTFGGWFSQDKQAQVSKAILTSTSSLELPEYIQVKLLIDVGLKDLAWFRSHVLGKAIVIRDALITYGRAVWAKLLTRRDYGSALKLVAMLQLVADEKREQFEKLKLATEMVQSLEVRGEKRTLSDLLPILSLAGSDRNVNAAVGPIVISYIHELARQALAKRDCEQALTLLSHISEDLRTPTTHELVAALFSQIPLTSPVVSSKQAMELLTTVAQNDEAFKALYLKFLSDKIEVLSSHGRVAESALPFDAIVQLRPDPDPSNDALRVFQALGLLDYNDREGARMLLSKLSTGLTLGQRAHLLIAGLYGNVLLYVLLLLLPLVVKLTINIIRASTLSVARDDDELVYENPVRFSRDNSAAESANSKLFVTSSGSQQLNPLYEEYVECLAIFGLQKSANLKTIKATYRSAVKEIHPDLHASAQTPEVSERFVRLTRAYDRIRELHKLLGLES